MSESNPLTDLRTLGQSPWCDQLGRQLLESGDLARLVAAGVTGVTSNPTIFERAIGGGDRYDSAIAHALSEGAPNPEAVYERLVIRDIQEAADLLLPVHEATGGADGHVSLEVSPELAQEAAASVAEARRLWRQVDRPNLMIKIPATDAGLRATAALLGEGVSVNVTLIFGLGRYRQVLQAHSEGIRLAGERGLELSRIASVASFFVSRVDTLVDALLDRQVAAGAAVEEAAALLRGRAAIANARLARVLWEEWEDTAPVRRQRAAGARPQRLLWASTSTKNPAYPDTLYVENLVGPETVSTMPPETIAALLDHGRVTGATLLHERDGASSIAGDLARIGIDLEMVARELEAAGVEAFGNSFHQLLGTLAERVFAARVGEWA